MFARLPIAVVLLLTTLGGEVARLSFRAPGSVVVNQDDAGKVTVEYQPDPPGPSPPSPPPPGPSGESDLERAAAAYYQAPKIAFLEALSALDRGSATTQDDVLAIYEARRKTATDPLRSAMDTAIKPYLDESGRITDRTGYAGVLRQVVGAMN